MLCASAYIGLNKYKVYDVCVVFLQCFFFLINFYLYSKKIIFLCVVDMDWTGSLIIYEMLLFIKKGRKMFSYNSFHNENRIHTYVHICMNPYECSALVLLWFVLFSFFFLFGYQLYRCFTRGFTSLVSIYLTH